MSAAKVAYIVCSALIELAYAALMVISPLWITPGWYYWSAFWFLMLCLGSAGFTKRVNSWRDMGEA